VLINRLRVIPGLLLLFFSFPLGAQEAGLLLSRGWSEQQELENPIGFSAYASLSPLPFLDIRASHGRHIRGSTEDTQLCDPYELLPTNCSRERVRSEGQLRSSSLAFVLVAPVSDQIRLGMGYGWSWNSVEATAESLTSERSPAAPVLPEANQPGSLWIVTAGVERLFGRLGLVSTLTRNSMEFYECVDDAYGPFCGKSRFTHLEIGLMYRVPGV
jgi:hypothetical protein